MARFVTLSVLMVTSSVSLAQDVNARPNILLIIADDLGFTDLGSFGSEISTPNLDELAYAGVRLNNLHSGRSCQSTRVMLMASSNFSAAGERTRPPATSQRTLNGRQSWSGRLSLEWASLPELLQDAGYETYMVGKWNLGLSGDYRPSARGFDRSFAMLEAGASHFAEYFWTDEILYEEDGQALTLEDLPHDFYSTRAYTDKMLGYLATHEGDAPWFAFVSYTAPHWPLQVPDDWLDRYAGQYDAGYDALREQRVARLEGLGVMPGGANPDKFEPFAAPWSSLTPEERREHSRAQEIYAAMVEYLDMSVGRIVEQLDASGQLDSTVIMFMSDNGAARSGIKLDDAEMPGGHNNGIEKFGRIGSFIGYGPGFAEAGTAPFKFFKSTLSEGGIRVPAFVRYPKDIPGGDINVSFLTVMDILPTFLDIAGTSHPGAVEYRGRQVHGIRGRSFWSHLKGESPTVHTPADSAGWVRGDAGALVRGNYKLINDPAPFGSDVGPWRLYDLSNDPGETRDLSSEFPELTAELVEEWETNWR